MISVSKRKGLKIKLFFFLIYCSGLLFFLYFNRYGYKQYLSLKREELRLTKMKKELTNKKETLKRELKMQNASSPFFIEMVARERLGMAKDGEIIYYISKKPHKK